MQRLAFLTALATCLLFFVGSANAAVRFATQHRTLLISRVTIRKAVVRPLPPSALRLSPNTAYIGTVTTIAGFTGGVGSETYDQDDGHFYILDCSTVSRLEYNGQTTLIANIGNCGNSIVWDHTTQLFYVTVPQSYEVLSVSTSGLVNVLAGGTYGQADGKGSLAQFVAPSGIALDPVNDFLYVADSDRMRRIDTSGNVVTVGPKGALNGGSFANYELAFDTKSAEIGITNFSPGIIGVYSTTTATYRALAGACYPPPPGSSGCYILQQDGQGSAAIFGSPEAIAYSAKTGDYYVADTFNFQIRSISQKGLVTTIAGNGRSGEVDGVGDGAEFGSPIATAVNPKTNQLLVFDGFSSLRLVTTTGQVPPPIPHSFAMSMTPTIGSGPMGMAAAPDGSLWFAESAANYLGRVLSTGRVTEYVLPGRMGSPYDTALGADGNIWFGDYQLNQFGSPSAAFIAHTLPNGKFVEVPFPENCGFQSSSFNSLTAASNGYMWLGGYCPGSVGFLTPSNQLVLYPSTTVGGVAVGQGTNVWVGAYFQLSEYSSTGALIVSYSNVPADAGVVVGANGDIWFLTNFSTAVGDFNPTTHSYTLYTLPSCNCSRNLGNLIAASNGDLWFTEGSNRGNYPGTIGQMTETGIFTEYPIFEPRSTPSGLAFSKSGKLWISDIGAQKIGYMR